MRPSMTFTLAGGPGVRITVVQTPDGKLQITASLVSSTIVGDLRGLFFQVNNEALLGGLSVTESTSNVTGLQQNANAVSNLGAGVNTLGATRASDVGIAFGTASTEGADDIRSVTFTLSHATEALTLDFLSQMQFAAVIGSVGPAGGARNATVRAVGTAPANAPPTAVNDAVTVAEGASVTIDVVANDTDPNNDALAVSAFTQPAKGTVTLVGGRLVFDAGNAFESLGAGESETQVFTYTVSDGRGGTSTATVTVTVTGLNDAPLAQAQTASVTEDDPAATAAAGSLLAGVTDPDANDVLTIVAVNGAAATTVTGAYGTLTWDATGGFIYALDNARPATDALKEGEAVTETFSFTVSDGKGGSDTRTLTVTVTGRNDAPVAVADRFSTQAGQPLVIAAPGLLANDTDAEGDPLSVVTLVGPANGTVSVNAAGGFTYVPNPGFAGTDTFAYVISDGIANSAPATVTVDVIGAPPPVFRLSLVENVEAEGGLITFAITRVAGGPAAATITYEVGPGVIGFPASADDVVGGFGLRTVTIGEGVDFAPFALFTTDDTVFEPDETVTVTLVSASVGTWFADSATAVIFNDDPPPPPPPPSQRFYFSGITPANGRELWVYDTGSFDPALGSPYATMIEAAEWLTGTAGGNPRDILALGDTVFWRGAGPGGDTWFAYRPDLGLLTLNAVAVDAFDATLPIDERTLGVRSGEYVWLATPGNRLTAFDANGVQVASVERPEDVRTLLSDAGGSPAYFADLDGLGIRGLTIIYDQPGSGWQAVSTYDFPTDPRNEVTEIAGLRPILDTSPTAPPGRGIKVVYFAGDHSQVFANPGFYEDALWRIDIRYVEGAYALAAPRVIDLNGTLNAAGGAVPLAPRGLTVAGVTDGAGGSRETLFLFGNDAAGEGRLFAYRFEPTFSGSLPLGGSGTEHITSTDLAGTPLLGLEIAPWTDGVLFSALGDNGFAALRPVVGSWTDSNGDGAFEFSILYWGVDGTIEHLTVDGAGGAAWVLDLGDYDRLYKYTGGSVEMIVEKFGEIDEVQMAGGHLVYRMGSSAIPGGPPTLFDHVYGALSPFGFEVPTDEDTGGEEVRSYLSSYLNVAIPEALVFEVYLAAEGGRRLFVTNGTDVFTPGGGFEPISAGDVVGNLWVGAGRQVATNAEGLYGIDSEGVLTALHLPAPFGGIGAEAEVLGDQILFSVTGSPGFRIMLYDSGLGSAFVLLDDHVLGAAEKVGSRVVFSAFDRTRPENTNTDPVDDVWDLWTYDPADGARLIAPFPATDTPGAQPVAEWWRDADFLGTDERIFWKQRSNAFGAEVFTIDLTAPDPVPVPIDINPGPGPGIGSDEAVFANGRLYWVATSTGLADATRLWTTTDGTDAIPVTGPQLFGGATPSSTGFQLPYEPVTIGDEVFFAARIAGTNRWGVFQVNDDGITASLITPDDFGTCYGLAAVGPDLHFFSRSPGDIVDQMWRITPGATPAPATPVRLTDFPPINGAGDMRDIFLGGDGNIYFGRLDPAIGRELHVLDVTDPTGARVVFDFNVGETDGGGGYGPEQVTPVPNPPEYLYA